MHLRRAVCLVLSAGVLAGTLPASAMTLSYETTNNGVANVQTGAGGVNAEMVPGSDGYFRTFSAPTPHDVINAGTDTGYGFFDDYVFTVAPDITNSITTTIDLGSLSISNLQERIYVVNAGGITNTAPVLGTPSGGALEAWTTVSGSSTVLEIYDSLLESGGTYSLQIRGTVTGSSGGTYSGSINFAPLPLPSTLALLASALFFPLAGAISGRLLRRHIPVPL